MATGVDTRVRAAVPARARLRRMECCTKPCLTSVWAGCRKTAAASDAGGQCRKRFRLETTKTPGQWAPGGRWTRTLASAPLSWQQRGCSVKGQLAAPSRRWAIRLLRDLPSSSARCCSRCARPKGRVALILVGLQQPGSPHGAGRMNSSVQSRVGLVTGRGISAPPAHPKKNATRSGSGSRCCRSGARGVTVYRLSGPFVQPVMAAR
jgi:hypothetical protein